jgi:hypothetical protein
MIKYQSRLNDVNNGLPPPSKKSDRSNGTSLGEWCSKFQVLEEKVRILFLSPLTTEFNLNTV